MENNNIHYIDVLWVEDQKEIYSSIKIFAKLNGINLIPYECWADAEKELLDHYEKWGAIILDGKCKLTKNDTANSVSFLSQVLADIIRYASEKNRTVPWFILSAGGSECGPLNDLINKERMLWDAEWTEKTNKKYYSKLTDQKALFERIKKTVSISNEVHIRTNLYPDVFRAINSMEGFDKCAAQEDLTYILTALHFKESHKDFKPIYLYTRLRQLIEHLFRAAIYVSLIPEACKSNGRINLNQCSLYIAGKTAEIAKVRYGKSKTNRIAPYMIEQGLKNILKFGNIHSHTVELTDAESAIIEDMFRSGESKYLLFGFSLILCDIILWFKETIDRFENNKEEFEECIHLDPAIYEGKEVILQKDKNNLIYHDHCCVKSNQYLYDNYKGKRFILRNVVINKTEKNDFLYIAQEVLEIKNEDHESNAIYPTISE